MKKAFLILVGLLCPLWVFAASDAPFQAGRDYLVLSQKPTVASAKTTVVEFFSYGCPACSALDPYLEKWITSKPKAVSFERVPVVFEPAWSVYAKTYLALSQLKLDQKLTPAIFSAIHTDNLDLSNKDAMADFLNSRELKKENFLNAYNSPSIDIAMTNNKKISADFMIFQIPSIIIDGKYKVDPSLSGGDYQRLIDTVNYLIKLDHKASK